MVNKKGIDEAIMANIKPSYMDHEDLSELLKDDFNEASTIQNLAFDSGGSIIDAKLADHFILDQKLIENRQRKGLFYRNSFYQWDGKRYARTDHNEFFMKFSKWITNNPHYKYKIKTKKAQESFWHLKTILHFDSELDQPFFISKKLDPKDYIKVENGMLRLEPNLNMSLVNHDPDLFSTTLLPVEFKKGVKAPTFMKFLNEVQPDLKVQKLLQQWMGYNLIHSYKFQKFMIFIGEGANGKSVFCTIMTALLGEENVSNVSLESFDEKRSYHLASTLGKLSNIVEDLNEIDKVQEGLLKKFTSGARLSVEEKYKSPFTFAPTARLTYATNVLPRFVDRSNGIWRRLMVVEWQHIIKEENQDRRFTEIDFWKKSGELPGILNWALEGLHSLLLKNAFDEPENCINLRETYKSDSNPALSFLRDNYVETEDYSDFVSTESLYNSYEKFILENGHKPLSVIQLGKEIVRAFPNVSRPDNAFSVAGKRRRGWQRIKSIPVLHT